MILKDYLLAYLFLFLSIYTFYKSATLPIQNEGLGPIGLRSVHEIRLDLNKLSGNVTLT